MLGWDATFGKCVNATIRILFSFVMGFVDVRVACFLLLLLLLLLLLVTDVSASW